MTININSYKTKNHDYKNHHNITILNIMSQTLTAMDKELGSLSANKVWDLVELPEGRRIVGSKWVFKTKKMLMEQLKDTRLGLWHKVAPRNMDKIMMKHFHQLSDLSP